jgi:hypothetical protein
VLERLEHLKEVNPIYVLYTRALGVYHGILWHLEIIRLMLGYAATLLTRIEVYGFGIRCYTMNINLKEQKMLSHRL